MTNSWTDIKNTDLVVIMGGNAAEAHPCGFKWVTEAKANRGAKLIVVDPRFTRSASVADCLCADPPGHRHRVPARRDQLLHPERQGAVGVREGVHQRALHREGRLRLSGRPVHRLRRGQARLRQVDLGLRARRGRLRQSPTTRCSIPRCVWNLLKKHVAVYTPEMVERICGTPKDKFLKVAQMIAEMLVADQDDDVDVRARLDPAFEGFAEHPRHGDAAAHPGQHRRARRRHERVARPLQHPGADRPRADVEPDPRLSDDADGEGGDFDAYMSTRGFKPLRPDQMSYWQNYKKFFVSFQKSMWGDAATAENNWAYDYLPKLDVPAYDVLRAFELMHQGKMNGYFCQGFNPLLSFPNRKKITAALSKLKFLVVMDPLQTETARFWENHGEYNDVDPAKIETEVIELPTTCFAEDEGSLVNSGRWLQWHWAGGTPPGEAKSDVWIMAQLYLRLKALYQKEGGQVPEPIVKLDWPYKDPNDPTPDEIAKEINGYALADITDPNDATKMCCRRASSCRASRRCATTATTACGCWIYSGCFTEAGNNMARRDNSDPDDTGAYSKWAFSWPANRRILYNRASADMNGKPWDPEPQADRVGRQPNGRATTCPTLRRRRSRTTWGRSS